MLEKQKTEGTVRKLVGFEMVDRGIPRHGYELQIRKVLLLEWLLRAQCGLP